VLCTAGIGSIWVFNTELAGITTFRSRANAGDGTVMAFKRVRSYPDGEVRMLTLGTAQTQVVCRDRCQLSSILSQIDDKANHSAKGNLRDAVLKGELALAFLG